MASLCSSMTDFFSWTSLVILRQRRRISCLGGKDAVAYGKAKRVLRLTPQHAQHHFRRRPKVVLGSFPHLCLWYYKGMKKLPLLLLGLAIVVVFVVLGGAKVIAPHARAQAACGNGGEVCCLTGAQCGSGLVCGNNGVNGTECLQCGYSGESACEGNSCNSGFEDCSGTCVPVGGACYGGIVGGTYACSGTSCVASSTGSFTTSYCNYQCTASSVAPPATATKTPPSGATGFGNRRIEPGVDHSAARVIVAGVGRARYERHHLRHKYLSCVSFRDIRRPEWRRLLSCGSFCKTASLRSRPRTDSLRCILMSRAITEYIITDRKATERTISFIKCCRVP